MKNKMSFRLISKFVSLVTGLALCTSIMGVTGVFAYDFEGFAPTVSLGANVQVFATDTVAGFNTVIRSSQVTPGTNVVFKIEQPDGNVAELTVPAGLDGIANLRLAEFYIRHAGEYKVSAKLQNVGSNGTPVTFKVLAGEVSEVFSEVTPTDQVVKIGREMGEIEITLKDVFGNPIEGHMVQLISSRQNEQISTDVNVSNNEGLVVFSVNSTEPGVSTYTAYDLTSNKTLNTRSKVVYFESNEYLFSGNIQGSTQANLNSQMFIGHAAGNPSGPIAYLAITELPASVVTGQSVSFTLTALDKSNQVVADYIGTAHFAVVAGSSTSVNLPADYTFVPQDLGAHKFTLALSFKAAVNYTIEARDLSDPTIFGSVSLTVAAGGGSVTDLISITNPTAGTYNNNVQAISGSATAGVKVVIYDNNAQIGSATSDTTGKFSFTTSPLTDGKHEFYAAITNEVGTITASSSKVNVTIDTTAPKIEKVETNPAGVIGLGANVEVKVFTESGLTQALAEVGGNVYELKDSTTGYYSASLKAPVSAGSYPIKVTLVDALGNQLKSENEYTLNVGVGGVGTSGGTAGQIGDVTSLVAYPSDHKVTLAWKAPSSGGPVQFYRIYYGLSPNQLKYVVDSWNANTSWYVPDLKNDIEYYFAVAAVDNLGNTSVHMSNIVKASPNKSAVAPSTEVWNGSAGGPQLQEMKEDVSKSGPETIGLLVAAIFGGLCYSYFSMRKKEEIE